MPLEPDMRPEGWSPTIPTTGLYDPQAALEAAVAEAVAAWLAARLPGAPGTGSLGGGGGGGGSGASRLPKGTRRGSLLGALRTSGFALPYDVTGLINQTISADGDWSYLLNLILDDSRFEETFPGIFDQNGVLRMTPAEWRATTESYRDTAAAFGFSLGKRHVGNLIDMDVSPSEFEQRANIFATLRSNDQVLANFNEQIGLANQRRKQSGLPTLPFIRDVRDAKNFITGKAPRALYLLFEGAAIEAGAESAGLTISSERARRLAKKPGQLTAEEAEQRFTDIASALRFAGRDLSSFGISQRDLETIEFGGRNRVTLAEKAQRALAQATAASEAEPARQGLTLVGTRPVLESEVNMG